MVEIKTIVQHNERNHKLFRVSHKNAGNEHLFY